MRILSLYFIFLLFLSFGACTRQINKTNSQTTTETNKAKSLNPVCFYSNYKAAMGSGKGILFKIELQTKEQIAVDSVVIGGKQMNFMLTNSKLLQLEVNYLVTRPEPSDANPNPKIPADAIIDEQAFNPAYIIIRTNHQGQKKLPITQFIKATH